MIIKRYIVHNEVNTHAHEFTNGDWVKYKDAEKLQKIVIRKNRTIEYLRDKLDTCKRQPRT